MDIFSSENWLSEVVLDDEEYNIFDQCQMDNYYLDDFITQDMETAIGGGNFIKQSLSRGSFERPAKQLKANSWNSGGAYTDHSYSSSSQIISFANTASPPTNNVSQQFSSGNLEDGTVYNQALVSKDCSNENQNNAPKPSQGTLSNRTPSHAQGHIMAERKRREKLSQRFIALSAIIPGLKKMDKASVLGDAIKYLKQLQERVNLLEEQTKKRTVESVVFVNKSQVTASVDEDASSSDENPADVLSNEALPEIEARVSEKNVLIRIHCEKNKEVVPKVLSEIEKLHLTVVNSSALPFGNHAMDITVAAQMENEFCMIVKDLVKNLRLALLKFK